WVEPWSCADGADFFQGFLRANISRTHDKDHPADKLESMRQHESFHFPIEGPAPVRPGQERPTNFDLAFVPVIAVETRRADNSAILKINDNKRPTAFQGLT